MEVARRDTRDVRTVSLDDHVERWRRIEGEVEDRLWKLSEIAASVVGLGERGAGNVEKFARAVGYQPTRIYQLSSAWEFRVKLFGRGEVFNRADGRPLTVSHFILALSETDPEGAINEAISLSLSTADIQKRTAERSRERGRKAIRETVGAKDPGKSAGRSDADGSHGYAAHPHEDTCEACGGFLMQMTRLGSVMHDLGIDVASLSGDSGVSEDLIGRMAVGEWVNQQMGMRVAEVIQERITARKRRQSWD